MPKKTKILWGVFLVFMFLITTAFTYAYFSLSVIGNDVATDINIDNATIHVTYNGGSEIHASAIEPGWSSTKTITITNDGTDDVVYKIYWNTLLNEITKRNNDSQNEIYLEATCKQYNSSNVETGTCNGFKKDIPYQSTEYSYDNGQLDSKYIIQNNIDIQSGMKHEYVITVYFRNMPYSQNYNQGKTFYGSINVGSSEQLLDVTFLTNIENGTYSVASDNPQTGSFSNGIFLVNNLGVGNHVVQITDSSNNVTYTKNFSIVSQAHTEVGYSDNIVSIKKNTKDIVVKANVDKQNSSISLSVTADYDNMIAPTIVEKNTTGYFWDQKTNITKIIFKSNMTSSITSYNTRYDISEEQDGSLYAYLVDDPNTSGKYYLYIETDSQVMCPINSTRLFSNFSSLTQIEGIEYLDTSKTTDMSLMFSKCSLLTTIDLSSFDTSKVTTMRTMFQVCSSLTTLDLSSFDTSETTDMELMFSQCKSLTSLDLSSFNTSKVTTMAYMFQVCSALTSLDLSSFDTSSVTDMSYMFCQDDSLTSLDLSSFNTSSVTNMSYMFNMTSVSDTSLVTVYVGDGWNTNNVTESTNMFCDCAKIVGGNGTTWSSSNIDKTYARVDLSSTPGYFTYKQ